MIYHITTKTDWLKNKQENMYLPKSVSEVGFIHCSTKEQVLTTANRRYLEAKDLLLLVINPEKVIHEIKYEDLKNMGEKHPHIYGGLVLDTVEQILEFERNRDGKYGDFPVKKVWDL